MSPTESVSADPNQKSPLTDLEEQNRQAMHAFGGFLGRITPWLFDVGSWIFGGLIAFILLVIPALLTVGPADRAVAVSTAAFALALPLNVTGLFLLKLVQDLKHVGFDEQVARAFREVVYADGERVLSPEALEATRTRRTLIVLGYCLGILALGVSLTLSGIVAALWHMAWWIGAAFLAMVILCFGVAFVAFATAQPGDSAKRRERRRRSREERSMRAEG